jgi:hypothetical protein
MRQSREPCLAQLEVQLQGYSTSSDDLPAAISNDLVVHFSSMGLEGLDVAKARKLC